MTDFKILDKLDNASYFQFPVKREPLTGQFVEYERFIFFEPVEQHTDIKHDK